MYIYICVCIDVYIIFLIHRQLRWSRYDVSGGRASRRRNPMKNYIIYMYLYIYIYIYIYV